jgi:alpha-D-xyloside xylohydrolase
MDWTKLDLVVFARDASPATGLIYLPGDPAAHELTLQKSGADFKLAEDPLAGKVTWNITVAETH